MKFFHRLLLLSLCVLGTSPLAAESARAIIVKAVQAKDAAEQRTLISSLLGEPDEAIPDLLVAWRSDQLFLYQAPDGTTVPVQLTGDKDAAGARAALKIIDGQPLTDAAGQPLRLTPAGLTAVDHTSGLRRVMKTVLDLLDVVSPDPRKRLKAVQTIALAQDASKLEVLSARQPLETDAQVLRALREAVALIRLKDPSDEVKITALADLKLLSTLSSTDFIQRALKEAEEKKNAPVAAAARSALTSVEAHRSTVDFLGTLFRGVSLGSILLVGALGLAITFGLMRVINMAHGEMIAVGAYTTYLVQNIFGTGITIPFFGFSLPIPGLGLTGAAYQWYFLAAIPLSFIAAALVGIGLERSVIRFLYRRPLESLLATWGVSLVLQQVFRLMFGANNVQVSSPVYLSGNWTVNDVLLGWNRVFVIGFAILIVFGMWLVLSKTSLGLLIRASMQNRTMASCMGVRTERVNMLTFGLGSGLAGLAGAFLSQIGNVGPSLGQNYIIDSFMVVVVGGVGSIAGTIISAFTIGGLDQVLQQYLPHWAPGLAWVPGIGSFLQNLAQDAAVFGKILVLGGIILFLQWKPAGLFVTRSRNLDE
ncbi:High-affinity branched-chain amino acid transport system permease protein LivH [Lacunisphaera limnophila]|uniref:High-affinity branched-chain amino acid transport system permease protein LivH n=1 Tax=Lacunisphaera limnophila TaxID=1838286 RepID=A0A1D8AWJ3_9BACT|nr:urea ABC transporter permease subunit UrtB [Lacunisphaera limnophila]AOS45250.1 High-affinity branched-chain amino acid transport system permease protein LivH [Lacunisphaera limnophila]